MEQETFDKIIEIWRRAERESTPASPLRKTEDRLSFIQFENYAKGQYTSEQKRHVDSCSYCQRMVELFEKHTKGITVTKPVQKPAIPETAVKKLIKVLNEFISGLLKFAALILRPTVPAPVWKVAIPVGVVVIVLILVLVMQPSKKYSVLAKIERVYYVPLVIKGPEQSTEAERLFDEGMKLYNEEKYAEAIQKLQMAVQSNPKGVDAHFYLGLCYLLTDSTDRAIEHLRQAIALGGNSLLEKSHWYLGNAYLLKEDGTSALHEFQMVVQSQGEYKSRAEELIGKIEKLENK